LRPDTDYELNLVAANYNGESSLSQTLNFRTNISGKICDKQSDRYIFLKSDKKDGLH